MMYHTYKHMQSDTYRLDYYSSASRPFFFFLNSPWQSHNWIPKKGDSLVETPAGHISPDLRSPIYKVSVAFAPLSYCIRGALTLMTVPERSNKTAASFSSFTQSNTNLLGEVAARQTAAGCA